jgi:uncharacterized protein YdeI (YjbR/CyaY-like superfamily)
MITDIEEYFRNGCGRCQRFATPDCSARRWLSGLLALRDLCRREGMIEALKWGHPCYMHGERNIAIIGAFRDDFRLSFMNAGLMTDPERILEKQGPNARYADMIRFTDVAHVTTRAQTIRTYLQEAMGYADEGRVAPKPPQEILLPAELIEALDMDPALAEAFHALTPGRQRSYVINLNGAKASATRVARIVKFRDRILAGKGATEL